jgi:hypothetical protein
MIKGKVNMKDQKPPQEKIVYVDEEMQRLERLLRKNNFEFDGVFVSKNAKGEATFSVTVTSKNLSPLA